LTQTPERHLIKKYANRKLYDTQTSRYITLEGIADLVRDGHTIEVVDRDTGQDLTQVVLSQIVLEEEKRGPARLVDAGADAIHDRGQALLDYVRKTLNVPGDLVNQVERRRSDLEGMVDEAIDRLNERVDKLSAEVKKTNPNGVKPRAGKRSR
jgi:polyhydroxyalkanoate synthesis repressor PhaR